MVNYVTTEYALDTSVSLSAGLATGLTQVLADSDGNAYLYGHGRIAQESAAGMEYFLTDALGSVRQLVDASGNVTLARSYRPYGGTLISDGDGASPYGFTGEWTDVTGMVHLRARYLDTGVGRFITRDTWGGDSYEPISYNAWLYAVANPVNLTDPSGRHPGLDHSSYCDPLFGQDRLFCERIVRGVDPETNLSLSELKLLDICNYYGDSCNPICEQLRRRNPRGSLEENLPHSVYKGRYVQYGWWWHYMLDTAPGWWNQQGGRHVYFRAVVAFALGVELGTQSTKDPTLAAAASEAFARKAWGEGFYRFIGSRQSVFSRINDALFGTACEDYCPYLGYNSNAFADVLANDDALYNIRGVAYPLAGNILYRSDWRRVVDTRPYEWGNPTEHSPQTFLDALKSFDNRGDGPHQVYYFNDRWKIDYPSIIVDGLKIYQMDFVVTRQQQRNLCNNASCVDP